MRDTSTAPTLARQSIITGSGILPDAAPALALLARQLPAGTYKFQLPVTGCVRVGATLRLAAHTGAVPTARLYKAMADGVTEKMNDSGASAAVAYGVFVDGVAQTKHILDLEGETFVIVEVTVGNGATATLDIAEYSALDESLAGAGGGGGGGGDASLAEQQTQTGKLTSIDNKLVAQYVIDGDSGAGVANVPAMVPVLPGAGGPVVGGTSANPFQVDGGADITGAAMPAGGIGFRGWLSAIYMTLISYVRVFGSMVSASNTSGHVNAATNYVSGQVWADNAVAANVTMQSLAGLVRGANSWGYIVRLKVGISRAIALPAVRVHFWRGVPSVKTADGAAFAVAFADIALYMGYVDLVASVLPTGAGTTTSVTMDGTLRYPVQGDGTGLVYYTIELRGAFASLGADTLHVAATVDQAA